MKIRNILIRLNKKQRLDFYSKVYDILTDIGANSDKPYKENFIEYHNSYTNDNKLVNEISMKEWRFQGKLGYGGKYYAESNRVDCYTEDYESCKLMIESTNKKLLTLIESLSIGM